MKLTIVSMLSVESVFFKPKEKGRGRYQEGQVLSERGDHLTLLAVYEGWKNSKFSTPLVLIITFNPIAIRRAQDVQQLLSILDRYKMDASRRRVKYRFDPTNHSSVGVFRQFGQRKTRQVSDDGGRSAGLYSSQFGGV
jgi:hypothetical protein